MLDVSKCSEALFPFPPRCRFAHLPVAHLFRRAPVQNGVYGHQLAAGAHRMVLNSIGRGSAEALAYLQQRQQGGGQQLAQQFGSMNFPRPQPPGGGILGIPSPYQQMQPQYNQPGLGYNQPQGPGFGAPGFAAAGRGQAQGAFQQAPYVPTPIILPRPNFQAPPARPGYQGQQQTQPGYQGQQARPTYQGQQTAPSYQGQVPVPQPYPAAQGGQGRGYGSGVSAPGFGGGAVYQQVQQQSWGRGGGGVAAVAGGNQQYAGGRGGPAGARPPAQQQGGNQYAPLDRRQSQQGQQQGRRY